MTDVLSIISFVCSMTKETILKDLAREIEGAKLNEIEKFLGERRSGKPLAYITKKKEFYSEDFIVDTNVLVPRPETETLVEEALAILGKRKDLIRVLDMGTGSGAIGLTIAKRAERQVVCVDLSEEALKIARRNAIALGISERATFVCANLFTGIREEARFDMILSNLPYVASEEWGALMKDVKDYEPKIALHGGQEGVEVYREFLRHTPRYLKNEGYVLCEIGGTRQAHTVKSMLESAGFRVAIKKDYSGMERVLIGSWTNLS